MAVVRDDPGAGNPRIMREVLAHHHNSSGFRGVYFDHDRGRWKAEVRPRRGKRKRSKRYATVEEAAAAYDCLAKDAYGDLAALNFPLKGENKTCFRRVPRCQHDKAQFYTSPKGQVNCRHCNRAAVAKYQARLLSEIGRRSLNDRKTGRRKLELRRCKLGKAIHGDGFVGPE
jgi:hypothetical protein